MNTLVMRQPSVRPLAGGSWLGVVGVWIERTRQRRALADLDDRLLDDVGISRPQAAHEIAVPFWR